MTTQKSSFNRIIKAPKYLKVNSAIDFITDCEAVFKLAKKREKFFKLDLSAVKEASMLGVLIIYKFIEYASEYECFNDAKVAISDGMNEEFEKYGFVKLIETYVKNTNLLDKVNEYKKLKVSIGDNFIIAPQALLRGDQYSKKALYETYLPKIEKYFNSSDKVAAMVLLVFSEVLLNFWEHAVIDTKSIIVAHGNKQYIEIACADSGDGIINTLGKSLSSSNLKPEVILRKAVMQGVTSKKMTNHMGYGLWIIDEIVTRIKGRMHIFSQGAFYHNNGGKKKSGKCGYWQGSIIYISLPLANPISLPEILPEDMHNKLQINWG